MKREACFIHPQAQVHPDARVGEGTRIGAFSIVEAGAVIGQNCHIREHVIVRGQSLLGNDVNVFPFAVIGEEPQHLKYKGEPTTAVIGDRVTLRESVTVHRGTSFGGGETRIGEDCYIMAYTHVAHDCRLGRRVIIANASQLAGHVEIGDFCTLGGMTAVTQFCRVGTLCYLGGASMIRKDLPPFLIGKGMEFQLQGVNIIGLTRHGLSTETIARLKNAFKIFYLQNLTVNQAIEKIALEVGTDGEVAKFVEFVKSSKLGVVR